MKQIRIAGLVPESVVDGPGFRFVVFVQGCPHNCPGCHNQQTHDFNGGRLVSILSILRQIWQCRNHITGITLSGGEPFCQPEALIPIAKWAHRLGLTVYSYSGFTYEQLLQRGPCVDLLMQLDALIDGPFKIDQRTLDARFRGSANQRLLRLDKGCITSINQDE